jgi:transmembrane sensor
MGRRFALAASLAGLGLAVTGSGWLMKRTGFAVRSAQEYSSPVGVNTSHTLQDGSVLELGGRTFAAVSFSEHARRVALLDGELFVAVNRDPLRPFSVQAGRLKVVATGTQFNVMHTRARTTVTVAEGSVDALYEEKGEQTPKVSLLTGQQLIYSHDTHRVVVRHADPEEATAWRTGTLPFRDEPLSEVVAKINRYSARAILVENEHVARLLFTGTALADNIHGWLRAVQDVLPVTVRKLRDGRYLIGPRPGSD